MKLLHLLSKYIELMRNEINFFRKNIGEKDIESEGSKTDKNLENVFF